MTEHQERRRRTEVVRPAYELVGGRVLCEGDRVVVVRSPRPAGRCCIEGLVRQPVGRAVLLARYPGVRHAPRRPDGQRLLRERAHVGVLDLPSTGQLLDHESGVHAYLDLECAKARRAARKAAQS